MSVGEDGGCPKRLARWAEIDALLVTEATVLELVYIGPSPCRLAIPPPEWNCGPFLRGPASTVANRRSCDRKSLICISSTFPCLILLSFS